MYHISSKGIDQYWHRQSHAFLRLLSIILLDPLNPGSLAPFKLSGFYDMSLRYGGGK